MIRKSGLIVSVIGFLFMGVIFASGPGNKKLMGQDLGLVLKPDLSIGVEDGEENYIFGNISRLALDEAGNIFVLDYKYRVVRVFDEGGAWLRSTVVPAGQGPREAVNPSGIAVTPGGTLFINDGLKVIVYGPDGGYLHTFKTDFLISSIGCAGTEECVAIGPNDGRILHLYDAAGRCLKSFGEYFSMPPELESFKGRPMFSAPLLFNASGDGRIFVLNPHKYEISVFKNGEVEATIQGKNDNFKPVRQMGRGFVSTAAYIVRSGELTLVLLRNPDPSAPKILDVFQGNNQVGTLEAGGTPLAVDSRGRIYFAEELDFPKVVRYTLEKVR